MTATSNNPSPNGTPARRKRMPRAERERQMLDVAVQVFAERGYVATSMDEIADRVGVSKPMLYEYFSSKEGLLLASIREARAELRGATEQAVIGATSGKDALHRGLRAFFEFIDQRRAEWSLLRHELTLIGGTAAAEVEAIRQQQTQLNASLLRVFLDAASDLEIEAAAEFLVGACERMAIWCEQRSDVTPQMAAEFTLDILWGGLKSKQSRPSAEPET